ncbi:MAG TPA: ribonuclease III [Pelomicrobium sp.]|nr:ribonuclease III [Pelomicrobium sp.]
MDDAVLARRLGYLFRDRRLLRQALTHRSHGVPHNERLEFLGDGVLNLAVAVLLFERLGEASEGALSRLRANLVNQETLAAVAGEMGVGAHVRLGEGELKSGGAARPSILADTVEALLGAIYLDGGFGAALDVVRALLGPRVAAADTRDVGKDPKTRLQELLQGRRLGLPKYQQLAARGQAHAQTFEVECLVEALGLRCSGEGSSRRRAEQEAARRMLALMDLPHANADAG